MAGSLAEFLRANQLTPNSEILYDVGIVQARLNRPVEAVAALQKVLSDPGRLSPERLERARLVCAEQSLRIGRLQVRTNVAAQVDIDGIAVGRAPMAEPVYLGSGLRQLTVTAPSHAPVRREIQLAAGQTLALDIELLPMEGALAQLVVESQIPEAEVVLDGMSIGRTPLRGSLPVAAGRHQVIVRRSGYREARDDLTVAGGATRTISLTPTEWLQPWVPTGTVKFAVSEPDADVVVDGKPRPDYHEGLRLAAGVHDVVVRRNGFFPVERQVTWDAASIGTVRVTLEPTEEIRSAYVARASAARRWSWLTIGVGAVVAGGATALYLRNQSELSGARAETTEVESMIKPGGQCPPMGEVSDRCAMLVDHANSRLDSAERMRTITLLGVGAGAAVLVTGTILRALSDDPHKYDFETPKDDPAVGVLAATTPGGATLFLRGRF